MERLTEKQSSGFDLKAMNGEWCNKYCEQQRVQTCNECGIYQAIQKLAEYEDFEEIFREKMTDTACEFLKDKEEFGKWLDRNKWIAKKCDEYARAEEKGLLLRLPTEAYFIKNNNVHKGWVQEVVYSVCRKLLLDIRYDDDSLDSYRGYLGNDVFLTQTESEQRLKEMESEKLIEFLKKEFPKGIQMFNTRNWVGDKMCTIYNEDGFVVDYCHGYEYIEVFGLSDEEFSRLDVEING